MTDELLAVRSRTGERFRFCPDCSTEHLAPVPCGMTYRDRLATVQVSEQGFDTAEKHRYFDSSALDEAFGPDRREQMLHETRGLGPVRTADDGTPWVYDDPDTGEMRPMERSDVIGGYLRGTPESELPEDA